MLTDTDDSIEAYPVPDAFFQFTPRKSLDKTGVSFRILHVHKVFLETGEAFQDRATLCEDRYDDVAGHEMAEDDEPHDESDDVRVVI